MRQLAWLHAVPEGSKQSRLVDFKGPDGETTLQFPELEEAAYLVALLQEAGLMSSTGMGAVPLSWQEIDAWLRTTELSLTVWEKLMIKEMSEVYVSDLHKSTAKLAVAPYAPEVEVIDRPAVAAKLLDVFRGFKRRKSGGEPT